MKALMIVLMAAVCIFPILKTGSDEDDRMGW